MKPKKMTTLDWDVYKLLEERTLGNDGAVEQKEIYEAMKAKGHPVYWSEKQNQHNDHCRWLANCVEHINLSDEVDHIVKHHAYRYRLADYEEAMILEQQYLKKIVLASKRRMALVRKMKQHRQGKLLSNQGNPITEKSNAKEFHETYNEVAQCQ